MTTDLISDLLTRVRNAQRAGHKTVKVQYSRLGKDVLSVLLKEHFIESFDKVDAEGRSRERFEVVLRYYRAYEPVISVARRISTSGRRVYVGHDDLPSVARGLGICVVSTSQGVMSDREARKRKLGGEILATIA